MLASTTGAAWTTTLVYAILYPVYVITGHPLNGAIALTWYKVRFLDTPLPNPLLDTIPALLFPVTTASIITLMTSLLAAKENLAAAKTLDPAEKQKRIDRAVYLNLAATVLAIPSNGPLTAAAALAARAAEAYHGTIVYTTNAGTIILGTSKLAPGPAHPLLYAAPPLPLPPIAILSTLLAGLSTAAYTAKELYKHLPQGTKGEEGRSDHGKKAL